MRQRSVDRVRIKYADVWNKTLCGEVAVMTVDKVDQEGTQVRIESDDEAIWPLMWFVDLKDDVGARMTIDKNLNELLLVAKR